MKRLNKILLSTIAPIAAIAPVAALSSCNNPNKPTTQTIEWTNGWYAYETQGTATTRSNEIYPEFTMNMSLKAGQTIEFTLEDTEGTSNCSIEYLPTAWVYENKIYLVINLKTTSSIMTIGEYRKYNVKFTCKNEDDSEA